MAYKDKEKRKLYLKNWWAEHREEMRKRRNKTTWRRCHKKEDKDRNREFLHKFLINKKNEQK
jgi:hypothetical protein